MQMSPVVSAVIGKSWGRLKCSTRDVQANCYAVLKRNTTHHREPPTRASDSVTESPLCYADSEGYTPYHFIDTTFSRRQNYVPRKQSAGRQGLWWGDGWITKWPGGLFGRDGLFSDLNCTAVYVTRNVWQKVQTCTLERVNFTA